MSHPSETNLVAVAIIYLFIGTLALNCGRRKEGPIANFSNQNWLPKDVYDPHDEAKTAACEIDFACLEKVVFLLFFFFGHSIFLVVLPLGIHELQKI